MSTAEKKEDSQEVSQNNTRLIHTVLFNFSDSVTEKDRAFCFKQLEKFAETMPEYIKKVVITTYDISSPEFKEGLNRGYRYGAVMTLYDKKARDAYLVDKRHTGVTAELVRLDIIKKDFSNVLVYDHERPVTPEPIASTLWIAMMALKEASKDDSTVKLTAIMISLEGVIVRLTSSALVAPMKKAGMGNNSSALYLVEAKKMLGECSSSLLSRGSQQAEEDIHSEDSLSSGPEG